MTARSQRRARSGGPAGAGRARTGGSRPEGRVGRRPRFDGVALALYQGLFAACAEEMGVTLMRTAHSPNIKERLDHSCAVFDRLGRLVAQAAHIPVHLGSLPRAVEAARALAPFAPGDTVVLNDPFAGGTHLPDVTLVSPVFLGRAGPPVFFVASRAHHALADSTLARMRALNPTAADSSMSQAEILDIHSGAKKAAPPPAAKKK